MLLLGVRVTEPTTLTLDARTAVPVDVALPRSGAAVTQAVASWHYGTYVPTDGLGAYQEASTSSASDIAISPTPPQVKLPAPMRFTVHALASAAPSERGPSDYAYHVALHHDGPIPPHLHWRLTDQEFATVPTEYASQRPGQLGSLTGWTSDVGPLGYGLMESMSLPAHRTEYYQAGVSWSRTFGQEKIGDTHIQELSDVRTYANGPAAAERWNSAARGPGLSFRDSVTPGIPLTRANTGSGKEADSISGAPDLCSDPQRRVCISSDFLGRETDTLAEDGVVLPLDQTIAGWRLKKREANYRLASTLKASPSRANDLSNNVAAEWTFHSKHEAPGVVSLPLYAIAIAPDVNDRNQARRDRPTRFTLDVYREPGAPASSVRSLTLRVSYDDGKTWVEANVERVGEHTLAVVPKPPIDSRVQFAAIEASASTADGATVTERITHAYRLS